MKPHRSYQLHRLADNAQGADWWRNLPKAEVDHFPWGHLADDDFRPATIARAAYTGGPQDGAIWVYMESSETELRAEQKGFGFVHTDSCMEFFLSPDPGNSPQYLNWEFNPAGGMYLAIEAGRYDRVLINDPGYRELFAVTTTVHGGGWTLEYRIPLSFLRRFFPALELQPGLTMRGNFYKCGDATAHPHYGCWSPIDLPKPDFHCPDFFGELVFEASTNVG